MKKFIISIALLLGYMASTYCQAEELSITRKNKKFYLSGQILTYPDLETILKTYPDSEFQIRKCNRNYNVSFPLMIFGSIGIIVGSGITLASSIQLGRDANNVQQKENLRNGQGIILVSGAIDAIGIGFLCAANQHKNKAIKLYNSSLKNTSYCPVQINLMANSTGLGISLEF